MREADGVVEVGGGKKIFQVGLVLVCTINLRCTGVSNIISLIFKMND